MPIQIDVPFLCDYSNLINYKVRIAIYTFLLSLSAVGPNDVSVLALSRWLNAGRHLEYTENANDLNWPHLPLEGPSNSLGSTNWRSNLLLMKSGIPSSISISDKVWRM